YFEAEGLPLRVQHLASGNAVSGLLERLIGGLENLAVLPGAVRNRRPPCALKNIGRHAAREVCKQRQFLFAGGSPDGGKLGALPIAHRAAELAAEKVLVGPFEVVEHRQCAPHGGGREFFEAEIGRASVGE